MKLNINEPPSKEGKNTIFGDTTEKIKTFAVLSAANPMGAELTRSVNKERMDRLKKDLVNFGIQYTKIKGNYGNKENPLILYNLSYNDILHFASKFGQESFFFAQNDFPAIITYYATDYKPEEDEDFNTLVIPPKTYRNIETSGNISNEKDAEDFFSRHGDFQFKFDMDYFKESVESVCGSIINENYEYYINRTVDDRLTAHGRINARRHSRRKDWE